MMAKQTKMVYAECPVRGEHCLGDTTLVITQTQYDQWQDVADDAAGWHDIKRAVEGITDEEAATLFTGICANCFHDAMN